MTIDPDVAFSAKHFGVDPALIQAVVNAEGNILRAVQCSIPSVRTRSEAIDVTCRSCAHAMGDFIRQQGHARSFVELWRDRWAPLGAANDPHGLNKNWAPNVLAGWAKASTPAPSGKTPDPPPVESP